MPEPEQGVFETMLVVDARPVELEAHLARLDASLSELFDQPAPPDARDLVLAAVAETELGRVRLDVSPQEGSSVRAVEVQEALVFPAFGSAVELVPFAVPGGIGAHKWADRRLLERAEEEADGAVPMILDDDGTVLEASRASVFLARDGVLVTPPADGRLLPGVTRAQVIELARAEGVEVREEATPLERLLGADEVFLTGAVRGIEPVGSVRGRREWSEGSLTARLSAALRDRWLA